MKALAAVALVAALAGCLGDNDPVDAEQPAPGVAYDSGRMFDLSECEGVEVGRQWAGPNGPRAPPPGWQHGGAIPDFLWSLEILQCDRLGWGPLERGPVSVGLEIHNAYLAPEACTADLSRSTYHRYIHALYLEDPDVVAYAGSWGLPAVQAAFSQQGHVLEGEVLKMATGSGAPSTIEVSRAGAYEGQAADVTAAFFWFDGEQVHRLTLQRETRATLAELAMIDMEAPSIMADVPGSTPAGANWLTNLRWTGKLDTFADHDCSARVTP